MSAETIRPKTAMSRALTAAPELWCAGVAFAAYPTLRPFSDETSLAGAAAFASPVWTLAHSLGILAFTLLGLGLARLASQLAAHPARVRTALTLAWAGISLTLPYYGAEAFGLHAAGEQALSTGDVARFDSLVQGIRLEAGIWFILLGLLALAAGVIGLASAAWRQTPRPLVTLLPLTIGVALYIPQFAAAQPLRIAHGLLMAAGCILLAHGLREAPDNAVRL